MCPGNGHAHSARSVARPSLALPTRRAAGRRAGVSRPKTVGKGCKHGQI
jgi:hypothetical protein